MNTFKTTTFLLVEDDANDVALMKREFKKTPTVRLQTAPDGIEAMRYLQGLGEYTDREKFPLPDVILLDLKLPRFSGFDFLEWLHSHSPDQHNLIPIVVMSSSALPEDVARAYALGVNSYMVKPVTWQEFRSRIKALGLYWAQHVETPEIHTAER